MHFNICYKYIKFLWHALILFLPAGLLRSLLWKIVSETELIKKVFYFELRRCILAISLVTYIFTYLFGWGRGPKDFWEMVLSTFSLLVNNITKNSILKFYYTNEYIIPKIVLRHTSNYNKNIPNELIYIKHQLLNNLKLTQKPW